MKFDYNGAAFFIEFERTFKQIPSGYDHEKQQPLFRQSRYPSTTVTLWKHAPSALPEIHRQATAGAYYKDTFTLEKGRLNALRLITKTLSKELRKAMWRAYTNRRTV